jgi:hypothetical protein
MPALPQPPRSAEGRSRGVISPPAPGTDRKRTWSASTASPAITPPPQARWLASDAAPTTIHEPTTRPCLKPAWRALQGHRAPARHRRRALRPGLPRTPRRRRPASPDSRTMSGPSPSRTRHAAPVGVLKAPHHTTRSPPTRRNVMIVVSGPDPARLQQRPKRGPGRLAQHGDRGRRRVRWCTGM